MLSDNSNIGRYQIARLVAQGGTGTLYQAQDPILGRPVALKLFLSDLDLADARERFVREARAAATLSHPNIVTIYDYGEHSAHPYMVMEFIRGETLAELIRRRAELPIGTRLRWMEELCSAVEYAHAQGVIHRDLKPLNLMVDARDRLKVLDFGIARMRGSLTSRATARIGTAAYMAPEQIQGGHVDHRSDVFSIGVVCYELFTYVEPFGADDDVAMTRRVLEDEPTPLQDLDPGIDRPLADLVLKALRKDPASRFQDAESMRKALAAVRLRLEADGSETVVRPRPPLPVAATSTLDDAKPDDPDADREDGAVRIARALQDVERRRADRFRQAIEAAQAALNRGASEEALVHAREALEIDRRSAHALALADEAVRRLGEDPGTRSADEAKTQFIIRKPVPAAARDPLPPDRRRDRPTVSKASPSELAERWRRVPPRQRLMVLSGVATLAAVAVVAIVWTSSRTGTQAPPVVSGPASPPAPLAVIIDAVPWARVKEVVLDGGAAVPLRDDPTYTPLMLSLSPGRYHVSLEGPRGEFKTVDYDVGPGAELPAPLVFEPVTVDRYFGPAAKSKPPRAVSGGGR